MMKTQRRVPQRQNNAEMEFQLSFPKKIELRSQAVIGRKRVRILRLVVVCAGEFQGKRRARRGSSQYPRIVENIPNRPDRITTALRGPRRRPAALHQQAAMTVVLP